MRTKPGPPMTLANMRQNGVAASPRRAPTAAAQLTSTSISCGRPDRPRDRPAPALQQLRRQDDLNPSRLAHRDPPPRHD